MIESITSNWLTILGSALGLFVIISLIAAMFLRRVVPTNMVHTVQTGKKTTSYGRGRPSGNVYYDWPSWFPVIGLTVTQMPESVFEISLKDYEAYDSARLPFAVDVTAFFRISDSDKAAQRVATFAELQHQLHQVVQGAVRRVLATNTLEETMHQRSTLGEMFTKEVGEGASEWGVQTVKMIEFMDLRDSQSQNSKVIQNIMAKDQARIDQESRVKVAEHARIAQLSEIEAKREVDLQKEQAEQAVGIRRAEREQEVGIASEKSNQNIQEQAKITREKEMDVLSVKTVRQAQITKEATEILAEQNKNVAVIQAEQQKKVATVQAEGEKAATQTRAEGTLFASLKEAEGVTAKGVADGAAETAKLMAPVDAQIKLAEKIASLADYQKYLIETRQIEANQAVGAAMAVAFEKADIKIVGGGGNLSDGAKGVMGMFTPGGGLNLAGMLTGLASTKEGKALIDKVAGNKGDASSTPKA